MVAAGSCIEVLEAIEADGGRFPLLYFVFSRSQAEEFAEEAARCRDFLLPDEKREVNRQLQAALEQHPSLFTSPGREKLAHMLYQGIAYHHAGLSPQLKLLVERLYCLGLIRVVFCTETFAAGVNFPAASTVFHSLVKWDGVNHRNLLAQEFFQMAGRAGRRGYDNEGYVYIRLNRGGQGAEVYEEKDLEPIASALTITPATVLNLIRWKSDEEIQYFLNRSFHGFQAEKRLAEIRSRITELEKELDQTRSIFCPRRGENGCPLSYSKKKRRTAPAQCDWAVCYRAKKRAKDLKGEIKRLRREAGSVLERKEAVRKEFDFLRVLLENMGYLQGRKLTDKGCFASHLRFQELLVTEMVYEGLFTASRPEEMAAVLAGVDYVPAKWVEGQRVALPVIKRVKSLRRRLMKSGVPERFLIWSETPAALGYYWYQGMDFQTLLSLTTLQEGDVISIFRREIDLLRQIEEVAKGGRLAEVARTIWQRLDRDEVRAVL